MTERLDRIEAILEQLAQRQNVFQQQLELFTQQSRALVQESTDDVVSMIGSLSDSQAQTQAQLDALSAHVSAYIAQSSAFLAVERQDRAEFRQQMIGLQTETKNILRELSDTRRQQDNGG